jgi:methyl-accepting chemotaxis protein
MVLQLKKLPSYRLRTILIVPFVLQISVTVGIVGYLSYRNGQQIVSNLASQLGGEIGDRVRQTILGKMEVPHQINRINADALRSGQIRASDLQGIRAYLWRQMYQFRSVTFISFGFEQKDFVGVERLENGSLKASISDQTTGYNYNSYELDQQGNLGKQIDSIPNYDPRVRPWYTAPVKAGKPTWSEIYSFVDSGNLTITAAQPYYSNDKKLLGVINTDVTLSDINRFLGSLQIGRSGLVFVVEHSGELVASSTNELFFVRQGKEVKRVKSSESQQSLIRVATQTLTGPSKKFSAIRTPTYSQFEFQGQRYFLRATPLSDNWGLNWVAVVVIPESDFTEQINANTRNTILLTLVALVVTILIGLLTANWVARPILQLSEVSQSLAAGNLDRSVEVKGIRELEILADSFNQMTRRLNQSFSELEQTNSELEQANQAMGQLNEELERRVEARTAELVESTVSKEALQQRATELLNEVFPISQGDLTIQAKVTSDEIGTIADAYNATVYSLRRIVLQVQVASDKVVKTAMANETLVQSLSAESLRQVQEVGLALAQVKDMAEVVQHVSANAKQAEVAMQEAAKTMAEGGIAMNRTVEGFQAIQSTVVETAKKVKALGEASQQISRIVDLINEFAAQTHLLSINASFEANRSGKEGSGFAVLAEEIRNLAGQSAKATEEIRQLIFSIQSKTDEVIVATKFETEQVRMGTKLVDDTRHRLDKITIANTQINELIEAIAKVALLQSQTSEAVTQRMQRVALSANKTSDEANQVALSFEEMRQVAEMLQMDVRQFKV